jgi:hypothetical protein
MLFFATPKKWEHKNAPTSNILPGTVKFSANAARSSFYCTDAEDAAGAELGDSETSATLL